MVQDLQKNRHVSFSYFSPLMKKTTPKSISKEVYFNTCNAPNFSNTSDSWIIDITHQKGFNKFLFLVKVCALHFKQLLACLAKRLISIAIYDRITQRIEGQK